MNFKLLKVLSYSIMIIPFVKILWLIFYYFGYLQNMYYIIGHSVEYDLILLALSFVFNLCIWHKTLILGCFLSLFFEFLQEKNILLSVSFLDFSFILIIILLIATLLFFLNGIKIKKNDNKRTKRAYKEYR